MKAAFSDKGPTSWAESPSPAHEKGGFKGSAWESAIVRLAASGEDRFIAILRGHIKAGVIRSERARAVLREGEASVAHD